MLAFTTFIIFQSSTYYPSPHYYSRIPLPPLSKSAPNGIFNIDSPGNEQNYQLSRRLYYAPNNHHGVESLIAALTNLYPDIEAVGAPDTAGINAIYANNLFDTWASLDFQLDAEQLSTGELITSQIEPVNVAYTIAINPSIWGALPTYNFSSQIYNEEVTTADLFWSSGYLTLQNFVDEYLVQQYNGSTEFSIDAYVQRFPSSPLYDDKTTVNITTIRQVIWKWIGGTILSICLFVPILSYLIELVRERQYMMKDMLDISGLMNISYWTSYVVMIMVNGLFSIAFILAFLRAVTVFDDRRIGPYAALMSVYVFGSGAFAMMFGFLVPRSEYYGLPIFIFTVAFTVCGAYMGIANNISASLKLFFCFLSPSVGLTMGVLDIENYLYYNDGNMDYSFVNENKAYPSLASVLGITVVSGIFYILMTLIMPLDWLFERRTDTSLFAAAKMDEVKYPCDMEEEEGQDQRNRLLQVNNLAHIYPDGTNAVKDMSFNVREGEVLSFLGANGAGKSTTMNMLCGTLEATIGDALVNGYSITAQKVYARRNLGIAMQKDVIWDDINVEDHLMLFGRLRGLHGQQLRTAVADMLQSLGFPEKRHSLAGTLSGGQKRRLCVGLAMVGGSSVVYLDEPTAGLDPVSRRQLWELVQKNRAGRAILLTTHFMDEADVLGDRIAIVKEGRLRAIGSSRFLKERFGLGYMLRMSMRENADNDLVRGMVGQYIKDVSVASAAGTEFSLRLPRNAVSTFPSMLERLENESNSLGVVSYGIETTTLEEVFMRIVNEDNEQLLLDHNRANLLLAASAEERDSNRLELSKRDNARVPLPTEQINALLAKGSNVHATTCNCLSLHVQVMIILQKRFYQFVRSRGQWAMGFAIPIALAIVCGLLLSSTPTSLLATADPPTTATFTNFYPTKVAGAGEAGTIAAVQAAFDGGIVLDYVGQNYSALYASINDVASAGFGPSSVEGIAYENATSFTVMYNATFPANFAGAMQSLTEAAVSNATGNLLSINQYYNNMPSNKLNGQLNNAFFTAMIIALIGGSFGAGLSIIISGERVTMVKHQQLASGTSSIAYWLGSFIWDFSLMYTYVLVFVAILAIFAPDSYSGASYGYIIVPGLFYVAASIFRFYSFSYFIPDVRMAQSTYFYGSLAVMYILIQVWFVVLFTTAAGNAQNAQVEIIGMVFSVLDPTFGFYLLVVLQNNILGVLSQNSPDTLLNPSVGGGYFTMMIIGTVIYAGLFVLFTEGGLKYILFTMFNPVNLVNKIRAIRPTSNMSSDDEGEVSKLFPIRQPKKKSNKNGKQDEEEVEERSMTAHDPDVLREREAVGAIVQRGLLNAKRSAIFTNELRKVYFARGNVPAKVAVKNVSVSIPQGEIFGLLGANGAGKTTLLKMVSGLEEPTSGVAMINGYDVVMQTTEAQRSMGLCPQFDTLLDRLSVRENLLFFGRIKGLTGDELYATVEAYMQALGIKRYEHKLTQQLSGGNRRKVSLAVALIGAPPTVYLDEPSTGLDPVASRLMWRLLSKIAEAKSTAIVLTTHNMLECEAVCTRVCIMKLGEMVCLGNTQHLRSTHGTGFQLEIALKDPSKAAGAQSFVKEHFQDAVLIEEHSCLLNYEIPRHSIQRISEAFRLLEDNRDRLGCDDYSLSQSTLEQVFLKQIRPNDNDVRNLKDQESFDHRVPTFRDYVTGYAVWACALCLPGLHHFYLGNTMRGVKYLCTGNEVLAGWFLDLFEMHVLIQKSVQEYGHIRNMCICNCCVDSCCCCCSCLRKKASARGQGGEGLMASSSEDASESRLHDHEENPVSSADNV